MSGSRPAALAALFFGLLAIAAGLPTALLATRALLWIAAFFVDAANPDTDHLPHVRLLHVELAAVPAGLLLGLVAVSLARRARARVERSVRRGGERTTRVAVFTAWAGMGVAVTGGLTLAVYGVLRAYS